MNRKVVIPMFIIVVLLINNVDALNVGVNAKKDTPRQDNGKGLAKGKSNKDTPSTDPDTQDPVTPSDPVPGIELDVYSDYMCTTPASNVDWGEIEVGSTNNIVLYIKNNGTVDIVASLVTENWYPETSYEYMTVGWDYDGQQVSPGEVVEVTLSLEVCTDCPLLNDFSFELVFVGS